MAGLNVPLSVARSELGGHLFISQYGEGEIHKYDAEGVDLGSVLTGFPDWQPAGLAWNDGRLYAASVHYKALASYAPDVGAEDGNSNSPEPQCVLEGLPDAANGLCSAGMRGGVFFTTSDEATGKGDSVIGRGRRAARRNDPDFPRGQPAAGLPWRRASCMSPC